MKNIIYYQLLDADTNELIYGNDNPANISDNTHLSTAKKIAIKWMKENKISFAQLWINESGEDCDNVVGKIDLKLTL